MRLPMTARSLAFLLSMALLAAGAAAQGVPSRVFMVVSFIGTTP